jgi:hypothetical protein
VEDAKEAIEATRKPSGTKSEAKVAAFAADAASLGWDLDAPVTDGELTSVTVRRGEETIDLAWEGGVFLHPCLYSLKGHTIQMRNAAAAKQRMGMDPEKAEEETDRVLTRKTNAAARRTESPRQQLPFDPELATDEEVLATLQGRMIYWTNGTSGADESDRVPLVKEVGNRANRPKIHEGPHGRILTFPGRSGCRSVLVSKIVMVK